MSGSSKFNGNLQAAFFYCVEQVRNYDYHHYLCLLHLPPAVRKAAFALRAFNVETSRAVDVTSDHNKGLMRLLWWQEAIESIFSNKKIEHPVVQALHAIISQHKINKIWLKRSINARIKEVSREETDIPKKIADLEKYAEETQSTILYVTLQAGGNHSAVADHAASHVGKASGLLLLIRHLPYHASRGQQFCYVPEDIAAKHGLLVEGIRPVIRVEPGEQFSSAVFEMASVANIHLQKARELARNLPPNSLPVMLPAVPAQVLLDSLQRCHFDVFDPRLARGILGLCPLWYQLKLNWCAWRRNY